MNLQSSVNKILLVWIASIHDKRHKRHCVNEEIFLAQPEIFSNSFKAFAKACARRRCYMIAMTLYSMST